jgi:hypothetical protein
MVAQTRQRAGETGLVPPAAMVAVAVAVAVVVAVPTAGAQDPARAANAVVQ